MQIEAMAPAVPAAPAAQPYNAHFRCFRGCPGEYSVYDVIYTCPTCGGLLEVHHDVDALRHRTADEWKALFEKRVGSSRWPYGSGVWGMREWVMPDLRDENVVSMYEGNTNLFWAERLGKQLGVPDLWIKLCGNSHTGSFKDLGMTVLVSVVKQMIAAGSPVRAVAAASTGDTSAALAAYAAYAGIPAIIFLPSGKVSTAQLIQPVANGAHVLALDTDFDGCMRIVKEVTQDNAIYLANSMNSIRVEGQKTVAVEIVRQFEWEVPDWIIIPVGNLGNISALYKGLKLMQDLGLIDRLPRLVAAQAGKASPFYQSFRNGFREKVALHAGKTLASAIQIGDPVSYEKAVQAVVETNGMVEDGHRARTGQRRRPRRPDRHVHLSPHRRGAGRPLQAGRAGRSEVHGSGRGHQHGARAEIHRLQGGLSRRQAGRSGERTGQPAALPARRRRRRQRDDCTPPGVVKAIDRGFGG
jgi:threonine synthase